MDKKRSNNWSTEELAVLLEEVAKRLDPIRGQIKGCGADGGVNKIKQRAWQEVATALNA